MAWQIQTLSCPCFLGDDDFAPAPEDFDFDALDDAFELPDDLPLLDGFVVRAGDVAGADDERDRAGVLCFAAPLLCDDGAFRAGGAFAAPPLAAGVPRCGPGWCFLGAGCGFGPGRCACGAGPAPLPCPCLA